MVRGGDKVNRTDVILLESTEMLAAGQGRRPRVQVIPPGHECDTPPTKPLRKMRERSGGWKALDTTGTACLREGGAHAAYEFHCTSPRGLKNGLLPVPIGREKRGSFVKILLRQHPGQGEKVSKRVQPEKKRKGKQCLLRGCSIRGSGGEPTEKCGKVNLASGEDGRIAI